MWQRDWQKELPVGPQKNGRSPPSQQAHQFLVRPVGLAQKEEQQAGVAAEQEEEPLQGARPGLQDEAQGPSEAQGKSFV